MASNAIAIFLAVVALQADWARAADVEVRRSLVYSEPSGEQLTADVYLPPGRGTKPAVLVVHGGAWTVGSKAHLAFAARRMAEEGLCAVAINYRLAPKYKFPAQLEDCLAAISWIRSNADEFRIEPQNLGGFGYSAGGHLVALVGTGAKAKADEPAAPEAPPLKAVVAGGAPCDFCMLPAEQRVLAYWLGGSRNELPHLYQLASPLQHVTGACAPMFFFHGERDLLVPLLTVKNMSARLLRAGVPSELYVVPEKGHMLTMFDDQALARGIKFLKAHLEDEDGK